MLTSIASMSWRTLRRQTLNSAINIGGLTLGLLAVCLIAVFARFEYGYDRWVTDHDRVYRLTATLNLPGAPSREVETAPAIIMSFIRDNVSGIDVALGVHGSNWSVSTGDAVFSVSVALVDAPVLKVFPRPMVSGTAAILDDPNSLLLSRKEAERLFGRVDVVGETVTVDAVHVLKIVGVYEDFPLQGHMRLDAVAPLKSPVAGEGPLTVRKWGSISGALYLKLAPGAEPVSVTAQIQEQFSKHAPERWIEETEKAGLPPFMEFKLAPLTDIHLDGITGQWRPPGDRETLIVLQIAAFLTLLMATINSINLTTARLIARSHEIALRRTVGARPGQLVRQLLGETCCLALLSLVIALALSEALMPFFAQLMDRPLVGAMLWQDAPLLVGLLGLTLVIGVVNAALALFRLMRRPPAVVLRGQKAESMTARPYLLIIQFVMALLLSVVALVIQAQVDFIRDRDTGFDAEGLVAIGRLDKIGDANARQSFARAVEQLPGVISAGVVDNFPGAGDRTETSFSFVGGEYGRLETINAEASGLAAFQPRLIAGRLLDSNRFGDEITATDDEARGSVVLGRETTRIMKLDNPADALGQTIEIGGDRSQTRLTVVGVIEDIQMRGLNEVLAPMAFFFDAREAGNAIAVRIAKGSEIQTLMAIRTLWKETFPFLDININYVDDIMLSMSRAEARLATLIQLAAFLAVAIAAAGLFAYSSVSIAQRTKEIGVRKVMGAASGDIVRLILVQFSRPILIASLVALPLAWALSRHWLQDFAYRIALTPAPFLLAGAAALVVGWATVGSHAFRVAQSNPVHALRDE